MGVEKMKEVPVNRYPEANANRYVWFDGKLVRVKNAKINVLSPTSQYGLNVFEGIRCYWSEEKKQLFAFRLEDHLMRLKQSQKLLQMEDTYSIEELKEAFLAVVKANGYHEDIAVRQTLFVDGLGSWYSASPVNMFISPIPKSKTNPEYQKKGLRCCISSWQRINDNALSPRIKCGANYMNSRMAQLEALRNGYDTAIFLNKDGTVAEGPGSCLFMVKGGMLITPLLTDSVLESITRDTIIRIARDMLHLPVIERSIDRTELYTCEEAFLCGSAMEITPILSVDQCRIGSGTAGALTLAIHRTYLDIVTNAVPDLYNWLCGVYERNQMKFSVLLPVCGKDDPDYFKKALESVSIRQTLKPNQIVIVKDGPVSERIDQMLGNLQSQLPEITFSVISKHRCTGLAAALNSGLQACQYEWIARMDSDDISLPDRFQKQIDYLRAHPDIDVLGGTIAEFKHVPGDIHSYRPVCLKHKEIAAMAKRRSPMNHVSVLYSKIAVERAGGYSTKYGMLEDYKLWIDLLMNGARFANLKDNLVFVRTGNGFMKRRSKCREILYWDRLQLHLLKNRLIDKKQAMQNRFYIRAFILLPGWMKRIVYQSLLRKRSHEA
jgi:branched-chain amino acid aminotransferase